MEKYYVMDVWVSQILYVKALTLNVMVFIGRDFERELELYEIMRMGPWC